MRNRAKCKLCLDIVESFHPTDLCACKCGEIGVYGGHAMYAQANDFANFVRVDDLDNEIAVKYKRKGDPGKTDDPPAEPPEKITRHELIDMLDRMIQNIDNLPEHAKMSPINHYDLVSFMLVISNILKRV